MSDLERLKREYQDRTRRFADKDTYSWFNQPNLFAIQQRQRAVLKMLKAKGIVSFADSAILEMGCGAGGVLAEFLSFGANQKNLCGLDILPDRLLLANKKLPGVFFANADGRHIPFADNTFDIVMQFTALSSILDGEIRSRIAEEMLRVLRPNGMILWYDFWLNPANPQTHGIRPSEIYDLFPKCRIDLHKITLAPPIARRVVPISWVAALLLENLRIFNSHYLGVIQPDIDG